MIAGAADGESLQTERDPARSARALPGAPSSVGPAMSDTRAIAERLAPDLRALRRELHQRPRARPRQPVDPDPHPEALAGLDLEITLGADLTSVVAVLRGEGWPDLAERLVVPLRGDMDGLPVSEVTDPWALDRARCHARVRSTSTSPASSEPQILHEVRHELAGDVIFMFQPGEEGPGGRRSWCGRACSTWRGSRADAAYAIHVIAAEGAARCLVRTAGADDGGRRRGHDHRDRPGRHGSAPHRALDPVPVACEIVLALQTMVTRRFSAFEPIVITIGRITARHQCNIIADTAEIYATVRTFSDRARDLALAEITRVADGVTAAHGLTAEIVQDHGYPLTSNDPAEFAFARDTVIDLFGAQRWTAMKDPEAGSEDMSFVLREVPGAHLYVSATPPGVDPATVDDNHSPRATFDDAVVPDMALALAELALRRCARDSTPSPDCLRACGLAP